MYQKGSIVAVMSEEEPFLLAECIDRIPQNSQKRYKIKWLERAGIEKRGTLFSHGGEDTIFAYNVICNVNIIRITRFKLLLSLAEEGIVLSQIKDDKLEVTEISESSKQNEEQQFTTFEETIKGQISTNKNKTQQETEETNKEEQNAKSNNRAEKLTSYNEVNIIDIRNFSETESLFNGGILNLRQEEKEKLTMEVRTEDNISKAFHEVRHLNHSDNENENLKIDPQTDESENSEKDTKINILPQYVIKNETFSVNGLPGIHYDSSDDIKEEPFQWSGSECIPSIAFPSCTSSEEPDGEFAKEVRNSFALSNDSTRTLLPPNASDLSMDFEETVSDPDGSLTEAHIRCTKKSALGKRVYDKRHACYFCNKLIGKVTRHLELVHGQDTEVAKLLAMDSNSIQRKEQFLCLLRAGDYYHNSRVLATKKGELILSRRPSESSFQDLKDYGPCPNCLGFFLVHTLWRHVKYNCPCKKTTSCNDSNVRRDIKGESYALLSSWSETNTSLDFQKCILGLFRSDHISSICREDRLIIQLGSLLFERFSVQQHDYIRQTMRQLARLVFQTTSINSNIKSLSELLLPKHFDTLIYAIKQLCISNINENKSQSYEIPSLGLKLGHSLRKCAQIARGIALRKGELSANREMQGFLELMDIEWKNRISSMALTTLQERKMSAPQLLPVTEGILNPVTEDILKLNKFLDDVIQESTKILNLNVPQNWPKLAAATLSKLILCNKRRSGEVSRMTLIQYACRPNWNEECTSEVKQSLTPLEIALANRLTVVEVHGKSSKKCKVPILLTIDLKVAIDTLIQTRHLANIHDKNCFVFARENLSLGHLRGHDCLKQFIGGASLQEPHLTTSTKLRKYIATVVQVFNLKENETDWLARHLGHDIRIHHDFFRLHESAVELTKVSRILLAVDKGQANNFAGKSLEEICVEDLPNIDDSDKSESESEDEVEIKIFSKEDIEFDKAIDISKAGSSKEIEPSPVQDEKEMNCFQGTRKIGKVNKEFKGAGGKTVKGKTRTPWSPKEKNSVLTFFSSNIKKKEIPTKSEAEKCKENFKHILRSRSWRDIKYCVYNHIKPKRPKT